MALSALNEKDMRGLTEMKPGSKMLIQAHSYSLAAANTHKPTFGQRQRTHSHQRNGEFIRGQSLKEMSRGNDRLLLVPVTINYSRHTSPNYLMKNSGKA